MKRFAFLILAVFSVLFTNAAFAQRGSNKALEVRLASFMPRNSDWGRCLDRLAADWAQVTGNRVTLRVIHDGLEGGEQKTLSSLSADNIQAALFTSFGLHTICPSVMTISIPFFIRSEAELDLVIKDVGPSLEAQIDKSKYVVLAWSKGGWVNIFSKDPVLVPDDLRRHRMATNPDDAKLNAAFKAMGFNLEETEIIDIGTKIANNKVNAFYQTPASVAPLGLYKNLKNMLNIPIAPFMGAIIINGVTWNKISRDDQAEILRVTRKTAADFEAVMPRTVTNAVSMMQKDGLKVNGINSAQEQLWYSEVQKAIPSLLGNTFDPKLYGQINEILRKARSGQ
ncbi:MAG: TRAP transporter substrate-binding protein DctP [Treponema sp.]|jgi:TRAP-type C4-dicarboxylate transport system substrate-binding protein|nr:TRAP transporter substrate-binding protein DctP [Treponema sp.]